MVDIVELINRNNPFLQPMKKTVKRKLKVNRRRIKSVPRKVDKYPIKTVTYVPSTSGVNKSISNAQLTRRVNVTRNYISKLFGGYTSSRGVGGYISKEGLVKERVTMVTSFVKREVFLKKKKLWFSWLRRKKREWGQRSIGVEIEGDMFYI